MIQLLDLYYIILDYAAPDIHVPISILLIQILDIIFHSNQKSHYTSSSFWMPGRIFTTVNCQYQNKKVLFTDPIFSEGFCYTLKKEGEKWAVEKKKLHQSLR